MDFVNPNQTRSLRNIIAKEKFVNDVKNCFLRTSIIPATV